MKSKNSLSYCIVFPITVLPGSGAETTYLRHELQEGSVVCFVPPPS